MKWRDETFLQNGACVQAFYLTTWQFVKYYRTRNRDTYSSRSIFVSKTRQLIWCVNCFIRVTGKALYADGTLKLNKTTKNIWAGEKRCPSNLRTTCGSYFLLTVKNVLPLRAAFQYGVKMGDGRKTRKLPGPKSERDDKAKLDRQWAKISQIISKRKETDK